MSIISEHPSWCNRSADDSYLLKIDEACLHINNLIKEKVVDVYAQSVECLGVS